MEQVLNNDQKVWVDRCLYISSFKSTCNFYDPISAVLVDSCGSGVSLSWNLDTGRIWAVFDYCLGVEGDIEFIQHLHIWIF